MLGGAIYRRLLAEGADVEGWSGDGGIAPDGVVFAPALFPLRPETRLIIHCAAITDADACEADPRSSVAINEVWPGRLAYSARERGARFIYISTDAVYDDRDPEWLAWEGDEPRPLSVYAKTKLGGERRVLDVYPEATVVRTTMFGWTLPGKREKLAEQIIRALVLGRPLPLWRDAVFSPLHVGDLGRILLELAERDYPGVLNIGAPEPITKLEFGRMIAAAIGANDDVIEETSVDDMDLRAPRTKYTALDVTHAEELFGALPSVEEGVARLARELTDGTVERLKGGPWPR